MNKLDGKCSLELLQESWRTNQKLTYLEREREREEKEKEKRRSYIWLCPQVVRFFLDKG